MGSKKGETPWENETPQFECKLIAQPYRISRYPVTVAQFQAFVDASGYTDKARNWWTKDGWKQDNKVTGPEDYDPAFQTPNHPRVGVSWYEAMAFCGWLSERLQRRQRRTGRKTGFVAIKCAIGNSITPFRRISE